MWAPFGKKKQLPGLSSWKKKSSCSYKTSHRLCTIGYTQDIFLYRIVPWQSYLLDLLGSSEPVWQETGKEFILTTSSLTWVRNCNIQFMIRSSCFTWITSHIQQFVFRMVHGFPYRVGTLWVGLLYLMLQTEFSEGESAK